MVDEDRGWLHQDRDECYRCFPRVDASESREPPVEDDGRGDVDKVLGDQHGCPHVHFEELVFVASG